ncbi:FAD-binding domain-containing protein [Dentipellis sp. KUC8613]|nr:FAD-binding domain-containing protein [Dentipellis sp. KUC8613]
MAALKLTSAILLSLALRSSYAQTPGGNDTVLTACHSIASSVSSASSVYFPGSSNYLADIAHWANSSTENAVCSVEPGTAADVGTILRIVGQSRAPFGVKGGGHSPNPGFSSTTGIEISMARFSEVTYHESSQTVDVGPGLVWNEVYSALAPQNVSVVGGRIDGVGLAGFTLGGGLSYKSNQHGLSLDNVQAYELVLPNGTVTTVTSADDDLWFALRGGFNNFGIVTKFTLKTFEQTEIWGGTVVVPSSGLDAAVDAIAAFQDNVTDPKANINAAFVYAAGEVILNLLVFYDAPTPPAGIFDGLLAVPGADTSSVSTRTFLDMVHFETGTGSADPNILLNAAPVITFSKTVLNAVINETQFWGDRLTPQSASTWFNVAEVFLPSMFSHGSPSAYPPDRSVTISPVNLFLGWTNSSATDIMHDALVQSAAQMRAVAVADGQDVANAAIYSNYALGDAPLASVYGGNVQRLHEIKGKYDPDNVMGLAGGFKF